jgi:uncharacterized SAM-binding protein YcdF (DUF218 family)
MSCFARICTFAGLLGFTIATVLALLPAWEGEPAEVPSASDAMVVLGGDAGERVMVAANLYSTGIANRAIVTGLEDSPADTRYVYLNWRIAYLIDAGMPAANIVLERTARNSREEVSAIARIAADQGWKTVVVISDPPHMRRLRLLWNAETGKGDLRVMLVATNPKWWSKSPRCWLNERCAQIVLLEAIKIAYSYSPIQANH